MSTIFSIIGRLAFVALFAGAAMDKINDTPKAVGAMTSVGMPQPDLLIYPAIACLAAGSALVGVGLFTRFGAALLLSFLIVATFYFHNPARPPLDESGMVMKEQRIVIDMMKNVALAGMCLFIMGNGAGRGSLDGLFRRDDA